MILVLFDVDGTLISTNGAGMRAFGRAMDAVFGLRLGGEEIRPDGKTDPLILKEWLDRYGLAGRRIDSLKDAMFARYLECLDDEMVRARARGEIRVLPGVKRLLDVLSSERDFAVGLATGNLERGARIKLSHSGLGRYFRYGGFGSDSGDRTELTRIGIERGVRLAAPAPVQGIFVIGDTPFDIIHGRAAGASVVAVAAAKYGLEDLRRFQPDLLLPDLAQVDDIIAFMRNGASAGRGSAGDAPASADFHPV